jgi:hypothetical protein
VRQHFRHAHDGLLFHSVAELARGLLELARAPAPLEALLEAASEEAAAAPYTWDEAAERFLAQVPSA